MTWKSSLAGLKEYEAGRHLADARAVTRLSAYVHHGQLSARLLHAETAKRGALRRSENENLQSSIAIAALVSDSSALV